MPFEQKNSFDDVFIRDALIALIYDLRELIKIQYIEPATKQVKEVNVPFFIDLGIGSSDRFYRDFYYNKEYDDCVIIHNYDKVPRIHVTPKSIGLEASELTSPYGQGEYTETIDGKEQWVSSFIQQIPITLELEFSVAASTFTELLKIWQALIDSMLYFSKGGNFVYKGINCPYLLKLEIPSYNKTFSFGVDTELKDILNMDFTGNLSVSYPSIRNKNIINIIESIHNNINL